MVFFKSFYVLVGETNNVLITYVFGNFGLGVMYVVFEAGDHGLGAGCKWPLHFVRGGPPGFVLFRVRHPELPPRLKITDGDNPPTRQCGE